MSKTRGYILVDFGDRDIGPVYAENPKREYIEAGDEVMVRWPGGMVDIATAVSDLQTSYMEDKVERMLGVILRTMGVEKPEELPKLIGTVSRDYWDTDEDEDEKDVE